MLFWVRTISLQFTSYTTSCSSRCTNMKPTYVSGRVVSIIIIIGPVSFNNFVNLPLANNKKF